MSLIDTGRMADCEGLRRRLIEAKRERNDALRLNAEAENAGRNPVYTEDDLIELRATVHMAALRAREAGCDIDDLVGRNVGDRDSPL